MSNLISKDAVDKKKIIDEIVLPDTEFEYGLIYSLRNRTWSRWHVISLQRNALEPYHIAGPHQDLHVLQHATSANFSKVTIVDSSPLRRFLTNQDIIGFTGCCLCRLPHCSKGLSLLCC